MKVILKEDVKSLGKKGQIVEVSDGYARNFILKKGKGVEATSKNLNDLKLQKANEDKIAQENYEAAQELGEKIEAGRSRCQLRPGKAARPLAPSLPRRSQRKPKASWAWILIRRRSSSRRPSRRWNP